MPNFQSSHQINKINNGLPVATVINHVANSPASIAVPESAQSTPLNYLEQACEIGWQLYELGQYTDDVDCFKSAAAVYREALHLAQQALPHQSVINAASMGLAKSLFSVGDEAGLAEAAQYLRALIHDAKLIREPILPEAEFVLGMLLAKQRKYSEAERVLDLWWATHPQHEHCAWVRQYTIEMGRLRRSNDAKPRPTDTILWAYEFSLRHESPELSLAQLTQHYARVQTSIIAPFPSCHLAFGRAFAQKKAYAEAIAALKLATTQFSLQRRGAALFDLSCAQLMYGHYVDATRSLRQYAEIASIEAKLEIAPPLAMLDRLTHSRRHAVLIGINQYQHKDLPRLRGAKNDVAAMRDVLIQHWGFQPEDIAEFIDDTATRDVILTKFKLLTAVSRERPCVFYFAGHGCVDKDNLPTIIPVDGRCNEVAEISLDELAKFAGDAAANLISIFDVGFEGEHAKLASGRSVPRVSPHTKTRFSNRAEWVSHAAALTVGAVSLYAHPPEDCAHARTLESKIHGTDPLNGLTTYRGRFTTALVERFQAGLSLTLGELRQGLQSVFQSDEPQPSVRTNSPMGDQRPVFFSTLHHQAVGMLTEIAQSPLKRIASALRTPIHNTDTATVTATAIAWHARFGLGMACAAYGNYDEAVACLRDCGTNADISGADISAVQLHYQLGRVLFLQGCDGTLDQAAAELRQAIELAPHDARTHYFLGQTIRAQIERQYFKQAETLLQTYLQRGAPFGRVNEVTAFLAGRQRLSFEF